MFLPLESVKYLKDKTVLEVLVVEDSQIQADVLVGQLKNFKFNTHHVLSLADAVEELKSKTFDLVMLDLNLPDSA